jgi:polysaccharide export outer membrane protein
MGMGTAMCLALAACNLPRGAALESEVLRGRDSADGEVTRDFAVEPVTRAGLARFAAWPHGGEQQRLGWIGHQAGPPDRIIAAGDVLTLTLWTSESNSLFTPQGQRTTTMDRITVSSTGEIFMPYLGNIRVSGMSPSRARETIEQRFVEISPSAQVQLELVESSGSLVSLVGGVSRPGAYPMRDQSYTILSLIAEGGGVPANLNNPQIRLIRGSRVYGTSVDRLYDDPAYDTTLRGGDKVIVEADERFFLSLGAAGSESVHAFPRDEISALEAVSIMGGLSDERGNPQGILVMREYPASAVRTDGSGPSHERVVFTLDLTTADGLFSAGRFPIESGDLVYATESPVTTAQSIFSIVGQALGISRRVGL